MKPHDRVDPFSQKRAEGQEGAKSTVAEHDIAFEQIGPEFYEELTLVNVLSATAKVEQGATGQRKDPHQLDQGKTAAGLLGQRLGVSGLVAGSIGHGEPGTIDHLTGRPRQRLAIGTLASMRSHTFPWMRCRIVPGSRVRA